MKKLLPIPLAVLVSFLINSCAPVAERKTEEKTAADKTPAVQVIPQKSANEKLKEMLSDMKSGKINLSIPNASRLDTIKIDSVNKKIDVVFHSSLAGLPFRPENTELLYESVRKYLSPLYEDFELGLYTSKFRVENLIPNIYRNGKFGFDSSRKSVNTVARPAPVTENVSRPYRPEKGLYNKNILLWHSHGWYYSAEEDRWLWQRPRLFEAVEDKIPMSIVLPYLIPMLENAGANVFVPRERDTQVNEVITDNDDAASSRRSSYKEKSTIKTIKWKTGRMPAFAYGTPPYPDTYNPFLYGTSRFIECDTAASAEARWIPDIPETGYYAVYVSYSSFENSATDARYIVNHAGGKTEFSVNQKIGGSTWIYLGKFKFFKGYDQKNSCVILKNTSSGGRQNIVSADAVRFGGGMGIVSRNGKTSGRPKFLEGSRYWLQFAGMPDTLVYNMRKGKDDYTDDFISRSEYGNYLSGAPKGPTRQPSAKGLGIPVDLSLALHTDAGITHNDTAIGTLSIYASENREKAALFPDGQSRMANRDLADIMQSEIVGDIRKNFDPVWTRRQLMDGNYWEAKSTNYPSVLIELLSHQNMQDMKFMLDPRFQFLVARSIYKSMLKYLAFDRSESYFVQPLPVDHFSAILQNDGSVHLKWLPCIDPLEPSAQAENYIVYTRTGNGDFDNGQLVSKNELIIPGLKKGVIYSFRVTALNKGGESFPSEILSVCSQKQGSQPVLIVNGFDRICGPAAVESKTYAGFLDRDDAGVPDRYLLSYTGTQYNFDPKSEFFSNDAPGHGASNADWEKEVIAGNTFDYPYIHGKALAECGFSFSSVSNESVWDKEISIGNYKFVDLILGEQKETRWQKPVMDSVRGTSFKAFPQSLQSVLTDYLRSGGNLFISGAYPATDLMKNKPKDHPDFRFAKDILKIAWGTDHASKNGEVFAAAASFGNPAEKISFNTSMSGDIYAVEAPDAIDPVKGSETLLRYNENSFSAAAGYKNDYGVIVFGFPFETIKSDAVRKSVMSEILQYFKIN